MMLKRAGKSAPDIDDALARFDAVEAGQLTQIADGLAVRHGTFETFVLPYDGEFVSDHFPLAISFHLLAFFLGDRIYDDSLNPIRTAILDQRDDPEQFIVERLLDRSTGYVPMHVLGLSRSAPHLVLRVQIFGPLLWHVHLLRVRANKLTPIGMALDVRERVIIPAAPKQREAAPSSAEPQPNT